VALKGDRIYVQGTRGNNESVVHALNRADGATVWIRPLGTTMFQDRGGGPRGTPTIDGDRLYALSEAGDLACLRTGDGSVVWNVNILREFSSRNTEWLVSESPLVEGNKVIVTPGGGKAGIAALDKLTGKTLWVCDELNDPPGYSSCVAGEIHGARVITTLTANAAVGVSAADGRLLWRYGKPANSTANIATPIMNGNRIFYTSAYGAGCGLVEFVDPDHKGIVMREVYSNRVMENHHGGVLLVDGHVYGFSNSILTCMNFDTGKAVWKNRSVGKGSLTFADGSLYILSENNVMGLAEASPAGYVEKGRFKIKDEGWPSWAHPVVCSGRLYIRNQGSLTSYDIKPQ
jgi:outer membrane protein assembly factor BamB